METLTKLGGILLMLFIIIFAVFQFLKHSGKRKYSKALFEKRVIEERTSEIPLEGNILAAAYILTYSTTFSTPSIDYYMVYLLKWFADGRTELKDSLIAFTDLPAPKDNDEKAYYMVFRKACQEDQVIHEEDDVKRAFYNNTRQLYSPTALHENGRVWFAKRGYVEKEKVIVPQLNEAGAAEARRVISLRNYLTDIASGQTTIRGDDPHMKEYVAYAYLFEIGQRFIDALYKVLPEYIQIYTEKAGILAKAAADGRYDAEDTDD
ncbi:MAG: hypothetical protein IKW99_10120 [Bacteroidales bacterium]|nr:hypothetical protein [Bacteroidales bacterium]